MFPAQKKPEPEEIPMDRTDPVFEWRYKALHGAGFSDEQALFLAENRAFDLHRTVDLARSAGPALAWDILS